MVGVALEARIEHPLHPRVPLQEPGHGETVGVVSLHPQGERLEAAAKQVGVVGGVHASHDPAKVSHRLHQFGRADHRAREQVVVAAEVLGGRVEHEIDTGRERLEVVGRAEGGVDERAHAAAAADVGKPLDVDDAQVRVCGRLADEELRPRRDRRFHRGVVAGLHLAEPDAESRQVLPTELAAAVVALVEEDNLVSCADVGHQQSDERRHSAGEEHGLFAPLEGGEFVFHHPLAGIAVAAILLADLLLLDEVDDRLGVAEGVGARREDRVGERMARFLAGLTGVHRSRRRAWLVAGRGGPGAGGVWRRPGRVGSIGRKHAVSCRPAEHSSRRV